jgi:hypothetical protein
MTADKQVVSPPRTCSAGRLGPIKRGVRPRVATCFQKNDMSPDDAGKAGQDKRRERLAAALRENLKRRKTQQRSRAAEKRPPEEGSARNPPADTDE